MFESNLHHVHQRSSDKDPGAPVYCLSPEHLVGELLTRTLASNRPALIVAGHAPLVYSRRRNESSRVDMTRWGVFSVHTLEIAAQLICLLRDRRINARLAIVIDDDIELPQRPSDGKSFQPAWMRKHRDRALRTPLFEVDRILDHFKIRDLVCVEQRGGGRSYLLSERRLKGHARKHVTVSEDRCSLAYEGLVFHSDLFDVSKQHLVGLIPGQCKGNLCRSLSVFHRSNPLLSATHAFFPHIENLGSLYEGPRGWSKNDRRVSPTVEEIYKELGVTVTNTGGY